MKTIADVTRSLIRNVLVVHLKHPKVPLSSCFLQHGNVKCEAL